MRCRPASPKFALLGRRRKRYVRGVLAEVVDSIAEQTGFAGVVSVDHGGENEFARAYGLAHRAHKIPNTTGTRFAIASGTKGLTALTVVSLIEHDGLNLATAARSVLGKDLPLIGDDVTIEHLLAHRSGIGDYLEDAGHEITDYVLTVPAQDLATTEQYLAVLGGHPARFAPGERFSYSNGGYVVLALIAERVSGMPFTELLRERVCVPAGMRDTEFLRSDELPERTAAGYLPIAGVPRTNVFHLPVRGSGDGGIYTTVADISAFWQQLQRRMADHPTPRRATGHLARPPRRQSRASLGLGAHFRVR